MRSMAEAVEERDAVPESVRVPIPAFKVMPAGPVTVTPVSTVTPTAVREIVLPPDTVRLPAAVTRLPAPVATTASGPVRVPDALSVSAAFVLIVADAELTMVSAPVKALEPFDSVMLAAPAVRLTAPAAGAWIKAPDCVIPTAPRSKVPVPSEQVPSTMASESAMVPPAALDITSVPKLLPPFVIVMDVVEPMSTVVVLDTTSADAEVRAPCAFPPLVRSVRSRTVKAAPPAFPKALSVIAPPAAAGSAVPVSMSRS